MTTETIKTTEKTEKNRKTSPKAHLSRRYHFSASHRLHTEAYSEDRNRAVFGKCNNPHGHGHNYVVQVTFSGPVDPATGMVVNLADLDAFAHQHLLTRFDHTNLNLDPAFQNTVSTTENLSVEIHRTFEQFPRQLSDSLRQNPADPERFQQLTLEHVHVEETGNNFFDFAGPALPAPGTL